MTRELLDTLRGAEESSQLSDLSFQKTGAPSVGEADSSPEGGAEDRDAVFCGTDATSPPPLRGTSPCTGEAADAPVILSEAKDLVGTASSERETETRAVGGAGPYKGGADIRTHLENLRAQAAELPGFDLEQALRDPAFVRLTAPGVGVPVADAWYALHREESERRRAEENRALLAQAAAASIRRPREGGGSGGAALIAADYRSLSREEQLRVKKRIFEAGARGEKVYP